MRAFIGFSLVAFHRTTLQRTERRKRGMGREREKENGDEGRMEEESSNSDLETVSRLRGKEKEGQEGQEEEEEGQEEEGQEEERRVWDGKEREENDVSEAAVETDKRLTDSDSSEISVQPNTSSLSSQSCLGVVCEVGETKESACEELL